MANSNDSVSVMKRYLEERLKVLEDNQTSRVPDEDVRLQHATDQMHLDWKADSEDKREEEEEVYLYLSSASRDPAQWPNPAQYQVVLGSEINNVIRANLVQASFPLTDPTVHLQNQKLRYSFSPFSTVSTVSVPVGSYTGEALAKEIMIQMNQDWHSASIPGTYTMDFSTGFLVDGSGNLPAAIEQFRVQHDDSRHMFRFQIVDSDELAVATQFALHIEPIPSDSQQSNWRTLNTDIYTLLGFDRAAVKNVGTWHAASGTYYLVNTTDYSAFGPATVTDQRYTNSLHGDKVADLRGNWVIVVDIDPLNDNDIAFSRDGPLSRFQVGNCFGYVLARDPARSSDHMLEVNSTSYPVQKYYRDGRSRIRRLTVTLRRPDGSIYDFGGADHFMAIRLICKRTQPKKAIFAR